MDEKDNKEQTDCASTKRSIHNESSTSSSSSSSSSSDVAVRFYHFDSSRSSGNLHAAQDVAQQFYDDIYCPDPFREENIDDDKNDKASKHRLRFSVTVASLPTPQQTNGYDCGVHVLGAAALFLSLFMGTSGGIISSDGDVKEDDGCTMIDLFCQELIKVFGPDPARYCRSLRKEVATLIRRLASEETTHNKLS
eukprot:CAMPEP_0113472464 /NCGR_PEP_ID=MMETSP0014_2-20120614/17529_1 /TAXON_ID=2857 /ORGANISM="Nitzschia sp." /LENGTH=193 /DNA_ID=CAMNT_0000365175 /DNA_START=505 /DNA_END=1086 /DNA_ORIENTATION=- /assembly_acc=CAM_ASM_000159